MLRSLVGSEMCIRDRNHTGSYSLLRPTRGYGTLTYYIRSRAQLSQLVRCLDSCLPDDNICPLNYIRLEPSLSDSTAGFCLIGVPQCLLTDCSSPNVVAYSEERWMFSAASVCVFVCQHDNFRTSKRAMMKLGQWVHCTKISAEFEFGGHSLPRGLSLIHI